MKLRLLLKTTVLFALLLIVGKVSWGQIATHVVISEVYGGGGNSGALYKNDFIELYNPTSSPISVTGWSVQYTSAAGTVWNATNLTGSVPAYGFFLIQEAAGTGGTASLPTPDVTGTLALSGTAGKVALVNTTTSLSGANPTDASIVDKVGFGATANGYETASAPAPSNTASIERKATSSSTAVSLASSGTEVDLGNAYDSNNNSLDFVQQSGLNPQNTASSIENPNDVTPPTLSSTIPADDATNVSLTPTLTLTFNEKIAKGTGNIVIKKSDGTLIETIVVTSSAVVVSNTNATITTSVALDFNTAYYVNVDATAIKDFSTNAYAGISNNTTWNFTTRSVYTTATVTSLEYIVIGASTWTISNIPANVPVATFEGNLASVDKSTYATFTDVACTTPVTGNVLNGYTLRVISEDGTSTINKYTLVVTPALFAATSNNDVLHDFDILFTDDATWRGAITDVKYGSDVLVATTDYVITAGKITLKPTGGSLKLRAAGTKDVTVIATGYIDAVVSQEIKADVVADVDKCDLVVDPTPVIGGTTHITLTAADLYGNPIKDYVFKYDATVTNTDLTTTESYTINSTVTPTSVTNVTLPATPANGQIQFNIVYPVPIDAGDGLSVQFKLNDGTLLGGSVDCSSPTYASFYSVATLNETSLNGATITVNLLNETFASPAPVAITNFTLINAPAGVTVGNVVFSSTTSATVTLAYDGTDFDANVTTLSVKILAAEFTGAADLTTLNNLTVTALVEVAPTVTTDAAVATNGSTTATWGGAISADGGEAITEKGFCWSTTANPTTANSTVVDATGGATITGNLTGLSPFTLYYVKAYAKNIIGPSYGEERTFTTLKSPLKAITATTLGTIDEANKKLLNVPGPTLVSALKAAITVSPNATKEVYTAALGTTVAPDASVISKDMVIRVTAQDLSTQEYAITIEVVSVANLVALQSLPANTRALYTGKATVTYTRTSYRNQKYIQDASGAIIIDDGSAAPGFITGTYAIGDGITNIEGKIVLFNGLVEFTPTTATGESCTGNPTIIPEDRTIASIVLADQSKLVRIVNYKFATPTQWDATGKFVSAKNYDIAGVANTSFIMRTVFSESNYIGTLVPVGAISTVCLVTPYNAVMEITPRYLADFQSAVATVTSDIHTVDATTITNVAPNILLADFKANLTPATGASFEVYQSDGATIATDIQTGYKVIVTAQDGVTKATYIITLSAVDAKDILAYRIGNHVGAITDPNISVEVRYSEVLTNLIATFTLSGGASAKVGTTAQVSGSTGNNFTSPVTYTVTAVDASTKDWIVTVSKAAAATDASLSSLKVDGTIVSGFAASTLAYSITLPAGTTDIPVVTATTNDEAATEVVTPATNLSGSEANRTATVVVTAEDGSTKETYTIVFTVAASATSDLFFSEYDEGSSNNKALEIYNPTSAAIDLSGYTIKVSNNGAGFGIWAGLGTTVGGTATWPPYNGEADTRYVLTFAPGTMLQSKDVYVIYNAQATNTDIVSNGDLALTYSGTTNDPLHLGANVAAFNGNDALGLYKGTTMIDVFGTESLVGTVVSATPAFNVAGVTAAGMDHSLVRKPTVHAGNIDWALAAGTDATTSEWIVYSSDDFTHLGRHTENTSSAPTVTTSVSTLTSFGNVERNTASSELSFTVVGFNLTNDVVITAPAGFDISLLGSIEFDANQSPITILAVDALTETTIHVKFHPTEAKAYSDYITITSTGATTKTIAVTGTGLATGINENWDSNISVYPNPFTNEIRFEGIQNVKSVMITNIIGQVLSTFTIGQDNFVSTQNLRSGIYFVIFVNDKGERSIHKMIKQ